MKFTDWLAQFLPSIAVLAVVAAVVFIAVRSIVRDKKSGGAGCSGCAGCSMCGVCHAQGKDSACSAKDGGADPGSKSDGSCV